MAKYTQVIFVASVRILQMVLLAFILSLASGTILFQFIDNNIIIIISLLLTIMVCSVWFVPIWWNTLSVIILIADDQHPKSEASINQTTTSRTTYNSTTQATEASIHTPLEKPHNNVFSLTSIILVAINLSVLNFLVRQLAISIEVDELIASIEQAQLRQIAIFMKENGPDYWVFLLAFAFVMTALGNITVYVIRSRTARLNRQQQHTLQQTPHYNQVTQDTNPDEETIQETQEQQTDSGGMEHPEADPPIEDQPQESDSIASNFLAEDGNSYAQGSEQR